MLANKFLTMRLFVVITALMVVLGLSTDGIAADRLVIKNDSGTDTFKIADSGQVDILNNLASIRQMRSDASVAQIFNLDSNDDMLLNRTALLYDGYPTGVIVGLQGASKRFDVRIRESGSQTVLFRINAAGRIDTVGGAYCNGTTWVDASSRDLKDDIQALTSQEAQAALEKLQPTKYTYKSDANKEMNVGFIAEDVPELVATGDRKGLSSMDIVGVLTQVVKDQQKTIAEMNAKLSELEQALKNK